MECIHPMLILLCVIDVLLVGGYEYSKDKTV